MTHRQKTLGLLLALLMAILAFTAYGCGGASEPDAPAAPEADAPAEAEAPEAEEEDEEAEEEEAPETGPSVTDIRNPTDLGGIVQDFAHLRWTFGGMEQVYTYEGTDTVDGQEVDKITIITNDGDSKNTFWVEDGTAVRMASNGDVLDDDMARMLMQPFLRAIFMPFTAVRTLNVPRIVNQVPDGWRIEVLDTGTQDFGDLTAQVTRVRANASPPAVTEGNDFTVIWDIGDFGDFELIVRWENEDEAGDEQYNFLMSIEEVRLR